MSDFFNRDMQLFIDHRFDWKRYYHYRGGSEVQPDEELATLKSVLATLNGICVEIAAESRQHWHEEVKLVDGKVVVPPHIVRGYNKLRDAGLVCLPIGAEYGGYGLPLLLNIVYMEMVSRANSSLMTIVGLQTGVASDIEKYGSDEIKQRYLPRLRGNLLKLDEVFSALWAHSADDLEILAGAESVKRDRQELQRRLSAIQTTTEE